MFQVSKLHFEVSPSLVKNLRHKALGTRYRGLTAPQIHQAIRKRYP
jgi:hypothetical protein